MSATLKLRKQIDPASGAEPASSPYDPDGSDPLGGNLTLAIVLHAVIFGAILGWAFIHPHGDRMGESSSQEGAVQASMVSSIPLPNLQRTKENQVLTSEKPSPAPIPPAKEKTEPPPKPDDLLIAKKPDPKIKPPKIAEKPQPEPPKHPQPITPQPTKAVTGETSGVQVAMATQKLSNGTASIFVQDRAFGARFAYYGRIINSTVAGNWFKQEVDPSSTGKRAVALFDINRDGTLSNIRIETRSGSPSLDLSVTRALQRTEGFGPLPGNLDHLTVEFAFDYTLSN